MLKCIYVNLVANIRNKLYFKIKLFKFIKVDYFGIFGNVLEKGKIIGMFYYLSFEHLELSRYLIYYCDFPWNTDTDAFK